MAVIAELIGADNTLATALFKAGAIKLGFPLRFLGAVSIAAVAAARRDLWRGEGEKPSIEAVQSELEMLAFVDDSWVGRLCACGVIVAA